MMQNQDGQKPIQLFIPYICPEAIEATAVVLKSGWIGLGPKTAEFETKFAEYVGAKFAVGMNSATAALHVALEAVGVERGDEVLTTSFTFVSTNHAILYLGATPVFVDVDERTLAIDLEQAERLITSKTKAIIAVHYGGNPVDLVKLYALAERHGLAVVEDAAHACGSSYAGKRIGSFGVTCFSFHAVKNLPTGDGGMVTTNDERIRDRLVRLRWMGIDRSTFARSGNGYQWEYNVGELGYKCHMNDIIAAIGIPQLEHLDEWNGKRRRFVELYRTELANAGPDIKFIEMTPNSQSANHLVVVRVPSRDRVYDLVKKQGIGMGVHYKPNHFYPMYASARRETLKVTEKVYAEVLSLPLHVLLTEDDVRRVCRELKAAVAAVKKDMRAV